MDIKGLKGANIFIFNHDPGPPFKDCKISNSLFDIGPSYKGLGLLHLIRVFYYIPFLYFFLFYFYFTFPVSPSLTL